MKITLGQSEFLAAIRSVSKASAASRGLHHTDKVRLSVAGPTLTLQCTDMDLSLTSSVLPSKIDKAGEVALAASMLEHFVSTAKADEDVLISAAPGEGVATISSGSAKYKAPVIDPAQLPLVPRFSHLPFAEVPGHVLAEALESVLYAACKDETRYQLQGVNVTAKAGAVCFAATDGHRMALAKRNSDAMAPAVDWLAEASITIPTKSAKALADLARTADKVKLSRNDKHLMATAGVVDMTTLLIGGNFPDVAQVIPGGDTPLRVAIAADSLKQSLKRVALVGAKEMGKPIKMSVTDAAVVFSASSPEAGTIDDTPEILQTGGAIVSGVNAEYLKQAVAQIAAPDATIDLRQADDLSPMLIRKASDPDGYDVAVVMPMRV